VRPEDSKVAKYYAGIANELALQVVELLDTLEGLGGNVSYYADGKCTLSAQWAKALEVLRKHGRDPGWENPQ
jgi:hypothetical protein